MNLPGFTADAALYNTNEVYRLAQRPDYGDGAQGVVPQLRVGSFGVGGIGTKLGFWCELGCGTAYAACLAACGSLTVGGPVCAAACSGLYRSCMDGC